MSDMKFLNQSLNILVLYLPDHSKHKLLFDTEGKTALASRAPVMALIAISCIQILQIGFYFMQSTDSLAVLVKPIAPVYLWSRVISHVLNEQGTGYEHIFSSVQTFNININVIGKSIRKLVNSPNLTVIG